MIEMRDRGEESRRSGEGLKKRFLLNTRKSFFLRNNQGKLKLHLKQ